MEDIKVGVIGEGISDFYVLRSILQGFTGNKSLPVDTLHPKNKIEPGNWDKVFKYCSSEEFRLALRFNDLLVVQLDTDFLKNDGTRDNLKMANVLTAEPVEIMAHIRAKLIEAIGEDFYEANNGKIVFAIAVEQIECWLLGIYYTGKKAQKLSNCIGSLNQALEAKHGFTIHQKRESYYDEMSKPFRKKKDLMSLCEHNASFKSFIQELENKIASDAPTQ